MKKVYRLWWLTLFIKLILGTFIPLSFDESYYWVWSNNLQLSYFDHPPLISWLFYLGHVFEPVFNLVRFPIILTGHLTLLVWIRILEKHIKSDRIILYILLTLALPILGLGSLIATPDVPLLLFWSLSIYLFSLLVEKNTLKYYIFLGGTLGLGFLSKYHIVLFVPCAILAILLSTKKFRIKPIGVFLSLLSGLIISAPVLIWNVQNNFSSFLFQIKHGVGQENWQPYWTYSYLLGQIIILFPTNIWLYFKNIKSFHKVKWIQYFFLFPLIFFLFTSFKGIVELNWPIVAIYPFFTFLFINLDEKQSLNKYIKIPIYFWSLVSFSILVQVFAPFIHTGPDKVNELRYFDPIKPYVLKYENLYLGSYQMTSTMWYEYKRPFKKLFQITRHDLFDEIQNQIPKEENFYIIKETWVPLPEWLAHKDYVVKIKEQIPPKFELIEVSKK